MSTSTCWVLHPGWSKPPNSLSAQVTFDEARLAPGLFFCAGPRDIGCMVIGDDILIAPGVVVHDDELDESFVRASGPGGQNVNKVATAVQLRFDAMKARSLPERVRDNLIRLAGQRATKDGVIIIEASRFRMQERNREDARQRLADLVAKAAEPPPKARRKTKPTKGAVERRLKSKAGRSTVKKLRGRPDGD